ncbi:hypothetical protein ACFYKT_14285 [Cytobacillus sp. FJAT-53684]|uniref:Uncharacterized protein n=1 Tax=Cytobacillus mangrovibacter TaxID=3299024 RepID=A0ABW6K3Q9_9BACI
METLINQLQTLSHFNNQQVVINFYEDEELVQREGLVFESIQIEDNHLYFNKAGKILFSLQLDEYKEFLQRNEFKNYFSFINGKQRVELYFP